MPKKLIDAARRALSEGRPEEAENYMSQLDQIELEDPLLLAESLLLKGDLASPEDAPLYYRQGLRIAATHRLTSLRNLFVRKLYGTQL